MFVATLARAFSPKLWLTVILQAWALVMNRRVVEAQGMEIVRLGRDKDDKKKSLWTMNKAELVEEARLNLGMTVTQAEKETVLTLRERLRSFKNVCQMTEDPLAKLPKGLDKMLLNELKEEAVHRSLPNPEPCTRAKLIVLIRDDVANRLTLEQSSSPSTTDQPASTRPQDEDWEMPQEEPATRRRR